MQKVLTDIVLATIFMCMLSVGIAGEPGEDGCRDLLGIAGFAVVEYQIF